MSIAEQQPRILLVEDEALVALSTKCLLEKSGYRVILASSGKNGLDQFHACPNINLVLMDINLGQGMDGTEAARLILQEGDLPVIFLSAYIDPEVVEKTEKITSYGYIVKGSGETVLLTSIKMALKLHQAHLQLLESEARLRDITFSMADWVWEVDENGVYTYSSDKGIDFFGKTGENIIGKTPFSLMPPGEAERVAAIFSEIKANKAPIKDLENWNIKENGEQICLLTNGVPILDEDGNLKGYRGVDKDITEHKRAEAALRRSEAKYRSLISEMFTGFALHEIICDAAGNPVDYVTIEINKAFEEMLNTPYQMAIGKRVSEILPAGELNHWLKIFGPVALTGVPARYEMYSPYNDKYFDGLAYCPEKGKFAVIFYDISDRKHAEDRLRMRERQFETLVANVPDVIVRFDRQYRHVYVNPATKEFGSPPEKILGKSHRELGHLPADMIDWSESIIRQVFETGKEVVFEIKFPDPAGDRYYLSRGVPEFAPDGSVESTLFIHRNITDRKQAEESLRENEAKFRSMIEQTLEGYALVDEDGFIIEWNPAQEKIWGARREDCVGRPFYDVQFQYVVPERRTPERYEFLKATLLEAVRTGQSPVFGRRIEAEIFKPDGTRKNIEQLIFPIKTDRGYRVASISMDITERKHTEDKVKTLLHEKEVLLKEVHHRIKNNMNTIDSLLMLQMYSHDDPSVKDALQDAASRVRSMMVLYDRLYRSENFEEISIKEYIPLLLNKIKGVFPRSNLVRIHTQLDNIILSPELLSTLGIIINELTTNALKHAFPSGKEGVIAITAVREADGVCITFEDDGVGLPQLVTFDNSTGFGMQLISLLVQQVRGSVTVERNQGTKFIIQMPLR